MHPAENVCSPLVVRTADEINAFLKIKAPHSSIPGPAHKNWRKSFRRYIIIRVYDYFQTHGTP